MLIHALLLVAAATTAAPEATSYRVDPAASQLRIHVGRAGLLSFAGHEHVVVATRIEGRIDVVANDPARSRVEMRFPSAALRVQEEGEPAGDAAKVEQRMHGADVLDVEQAPQILFRSAAVALRARPEADVYDLLIEGPLELRGVSKPVVVSVKVDLRDGTLRARGTARLRQTVFGLSPVSVAGVVKVADELAVDFDVVARREPAAAQPSAKPSPDPH